MLITHKQLQEINKVQIEILRAVAEVCERLNIVFYMVHGSLLGTIRSQGFVPDDDDIDIAFFRKDYEVFVKEAPKILAKQYFIQTYQTDAGYPLPFGKVRDSRTTYIIEDAKHIKMNHGIYIDVFPIDFCSVGSFRAKISAARYKLLNVRISNVYRVSGESAVKRFARSLTKVLIPSQSCAIRSREKLLTSVEAGLFVRISGGKATEQCMPVSWFETPKKDVFEGIPVSIPAGYKNYLAQIYGDYQNRTLVEDKISNAESIEINACAVDTNIRHFCIPLYLYLGLSSCIPKSSS